MILSIVEVWQLRLYMECYSPKCNTHLTSVAEAMWFQEPTESKDFDWSFSPILRWLRLIGVDLNSYESHSICQRVYQLSLFGCNVFIQAVYFLVAVDEKESVWIVGKKRTSTFYWTWLTGTINMTFNALVTHSLLLFYVGKRWKNLKASIKAVKGHFDADLKVKLRRNSVVAVIYVIVAVQYITCLLIGSLE